MLTRLGLALMALWAFFGLIGAGIMFKPELSDWPILMGGALVGIVSFFAYAYWRG